MEENNNNEKDIKKETIEWIKCILSAVVIAVLIKTFIFNTTYVLGNSMYPTLHDSDVSTLTKIRGEQLGMIFRDFQLIDFLNAKENIKLINSHLKDNNLDELLKKLNLLLGGDR